MCFHLRRVAAVIVSNGVLRQIKICNRLVDIYIILALLAYTPAIFLEVRSISVSTNQFPNRNVLNVSEQ